MVNLRQALISSGWTALDARTDPRAYCEGSNRYGTLQKGGVRLALSCGQALVTERGVVMVYMTDEPTDVILRALLVDQERRGHGRATQAMHELVMLSDVCGCRLQLEPVPLLDKPLTASQLQSFYRRFGFEFEDSQNRVMRRPPNKNRSQN